MTPTLRSHKKLKARMSPRRRFTRREKMMTKLALKDKVQQLQIEHAKTRGGVNSCGRGIELVFRKERLTRRALYAALIFLGVTEFHRVQDIALDGVQTVELAAASAFAVALLYVYDWARSWFNGWRERRKNARLVAQMGQSAQA